MNDADNLDDFEDICINTAIDTISATIAYTSKNSDSDGIMKRLEHHQVHEAKEH